MENELETIQQIYNVVVEFIINYSFQILDAIPHQTMGLP